MNHVAKSTKGFTIVELMLAMSFIAVLLLAIAMTIIQISTIYTKGLTLKEVNQTARDIADDMRRTVSASGQVNLATDFVEVTNGAAKVGGRLCLGSSSYVWNFGSAIETNNARTIKYSPADGKIIRLLKVPDGTKAYCQKNEDGQVAVPNLLPADTASARELLRAGDRTLSLHAMSVTSSDSAHSTSTGQRLYQINFTIGTQQTSLINLASTPVNCKTPAEIGPDFNYCTVQSFAIVVRTGSGV